MQKNLEEYKKEMKEQKKLVSSIKKEFINQCKNGIWKFLYNNSNEESYENEYFRLRLTNKSNIISILNDNYSIDLTKIGISWLRLFILFNFYIKRTAKKLQKTKEMESAFIFSNKFFEKNKQLMRESRINTIIN